MVHISYVWLYTRVCVCVCVWQLGEVELSLKFRAGSPIEDLATGFIRAPKGCQVHRDSATLIKSTKDPLII